MHALAFYNLLRVVGAVAGNLVLLSLLGGLAVAVSWHVASMVPLGVQSL